MEPTGKPIFNPVAYADLNARQKENFNFQKLSAVLADFGYATLRLSDDWHGADFIAQHVSGKTFLLVQLKGRLTIKKDYEGKGLCVAFFADDGFWYLYPHDELVPQILSHTSVGTTRSWIERRGYSFRHIPANLIDLLKPYRIPLKVSDDQVPIQTDDPDVSDEP